MQQTGLQKDLFWKAFFIGTLLLSIPPFTTSCLKYEPRIGGVTNQSPENFEDVIITDYAAEFYDGKVKTWQLYGEKARIYEAKNQIVLADMKMIHFSQDGQLLSFTTADSAYVNPSSSNVILSNRVVITSSNKNRIMGEYFLWNNRTQQITSPQKVTIEQENGDVISGYGFSADGSFENISFERNVSGTAEDR